ncbi:Probable transposable element [Penicillium roqueforti FM164]|uniref:Probable transposable element n=1 Tax=Penicillium roqueforti (strain FM164) TaxID=1365484 RepID=W6PRG1_PENRF|nr:Probable transposable element [Penicillium roqueforti FM164]
MIFKGKVFIKSWFNGLPDDWRFEPLDIGYFAVLKRLYSWMVETKIRSGINYIDKLDFLEAYPSARIEAFKEDTIKNSFGAAESEWEPKTPSNYKQLLKQASSIKALLRTRSRSPPSPLNSAINQVLKACQVTMQSAAFLEKEVSDLRAANEKQKQKRTRSRKQIPSTEGLSVLEASILIVQPEEAIEPPPPPQLRRPSPPLLPRTRVLNRCGACGNLGHKRNACPDRPR